MSLVTGGMGRPGGLVVTRGLGWAPAGAPPPPLWVGTSLRRVAATKLLTLVAQITPRPAGMLAVDVPDSDTAAATPPRSSNRVESANPAEAATLAVPASTVEATDTLRSHSEVTP